MDKNVYLSILERIKRGDNPTKIAKDLGKSKQALNRYISTLKCIGCIRKVGYGSWEYIKGFDIKEVNKQAVIGSELGIIEPKDVGIQKLKKALEKSGLNKCVFCSNENIVIHHIKSTNEGGDNNILNLIPVCPNHHKLIHENKISKEEKKEIKKYFKELEKKNYLRANTVRGHGFMFKLDIPDNFKNWNKREEILSKLKINFKPYYVGGVKRGQRITTKKTKIALTDKSIIMHFPESYIRETATLCKKDAVAKFLKVIKHLERILRANFSEFGKYKFRVSRQHYSLMKNSLARQYLDNQYSKKKLHVYSSRGLWLLVDNSYNLEELETVHKKTAVKDNEKVQDFFNGLDMVEGYTPQFVLKAIAKNTANLNYHGENMSTHVKLMQNIDKNLGKQTELFEKQTALIEYSLRDKPKYKT